MEQFVMNGKIAMLNKSTKKQDEFFDLVSKVSRMQGMRDSDLALNAGVSSTYLSLTKNGHSALSLTGMYSIANALGIQVTIEFKTHD